MSFCVCDDDAVKATTINLLKAGDSIKNLCRRGANLFYSYFRTKDDLKKIPYDCYIRK